MLPVLVPAKVPTNLLEWIAQLLCHLGGGMCIA